MRACVRACVYGVCVLCVWVCVGVCVCMCVCSICVCGMCVCTCMRACMSSYSSVIQSLFLFQCKILLKQFLCFVLAIFYLLNGGQTISKDLLVRILTRTFTQGTETEESHNSKV